MAFLTLNGLTVPISRGGSSEVYNHGASGVAFNGRGYRENKSRYRVWRFETSIVDPMLGETLIGMINGTGDRWQFEHTTPFADDDTFSDKGVASNTSGTEAFSLLPNIAADGKAVFDFNGVREGKYTSNSAIRLEDACDNLASDDSSDCENTTTGWNAGGGMALVSDSTNYCQGTKGIKCTTSGVGDSAYSDAINCNAGAFHTATVYVYASASQTIRLNLEDDDGGWGVIATSDFTVDNSGWYWVYVSGATGAGATQIRLDIEDRSGAGYFVIDAFTMEEKLFPGHWTLGQTTRSAGNLSYPVSFPRDECSFGCWFKNSRVTYSGNRHIISVVSSTDSGAFTVYNTSSQNYLGYASYGTDGSSTSANLTGTDISDEDWHHLVVVLRGKNASGTAKYREIYLDGTLEDSGTTANFPRITTLDTIRPCMDVTGTSNLWRWGAVDGMLVLPYAADADYASALAAVSIQPADLPYLTATGDMLTDDARYGVEVFGRVMSVAYEPAWIDGTQYPNAMRVRFELETREEY